MINVSKLSILFVCNMDRATSLQRYFALKNNFDYVQRLYHSNYSIKRSLFQRIIRAIFHRIGYTREFYGENSKLLDTISRNTFDIVLIEKSLTIRPQTLQQAKKNSINTKFILYNLDDFMNKTNQSSYFIRCIPLYNVIATNKKYNVREYRQFGGKNVIYFKNAFSTDFHNIVTPTTEEYQYYASDILFIGAFEKHRVDYLNYLANAGYSIKVFGWGIKGSNKLKHPNITNMNQHLYGDDFCKAIISAKISLNFLRKANRDTETTRTVEIPACGGFMLSERSVEQQNMFEEKYEAEYFDSKEEMLSKTKYYLTNSEERLAIAKQGYNKTRSSNFSYNAQLKQIIQKAITV
ncbi:MAG: spore maturation protein CgeB [Bacteroidia bacterium]